MNEQDQPLPSDYLETLSATEPTDAAMRKSSANERESAVREIPMSDLEEAPTPDLIHTPEMSDLNTPGDVDIEDLDEDALGDALPPEARLDPLED